MAAKHSRKRRLRVTELGRHQSSSVGGRAKTAVETAAKTLRGLRVGRNLGSWI